MKKLIIAGLAAFLLGTAAMPSPAEARCWWNGYGWHCWHPQAWWWRRHHYWHPYAWRRHPHPYAWRWHPHPYAWQ